jgi:fatty-acyl-CoA synthase
MPRFDPSRFRSLRSGIIAGGPVSENLGRSVRAPRAIAIAPGLAETGPTVRAVDLVTGQPHRPGGVTGSTVRGPGVTSGSQLPVESRRSSTPAAGFFTGELGVIGADGCVRIVGRRRETILRGGRQIPLREVNDQLRAHPAVNDVCVIGVPHEGLGELVCARIVKVPDLARFSAACPTHGVGTGRGDCSSAHSHSTTPPS